MTDISLPSGFEDLSEWKDWDLETMTLRSAKRSSSTMEELQSFYDALLPRMAEILEFLTTVKMSEDMKPENLSLLNLSKSMDISNNCQNV